MMVGSAGAEWLISTFLLVSTLLEGGGCGVSTVAVTDFHPFLDWSSYFRQTIVCNERETKKQHVNDTFKVGPSYYQSDTQMFHTISTR